MSTKRADGGISDESMRRALELVRRVPLEGNARFRIFGGTRKMLDQAQREVEEGFRQAGFAV
jgi:hypothetical protein